MNFLKTLKIIVGIPFFAVIGVFIALGLFLVNWLLPKQQTTTRQQQKEDLNKRKEQYRKQAKTIVIDDLQQSIDWQNYSYPSTITANFFKRQQKKKELQKRRKRNKIARKSRQQNRKNK